MVVTSLLRSQKSYFRFAPDQEIKQHIRGKRQRWTLPLTGLQYRIEHNDGSANLWADLPSGWGLQSSKQGVTTRCKFCDAAVPLNLIKINNMNTSTLIDLRLR